MEAVPPEEEEPRLGLDQQRFYWTWFELADLYTKTIDAEAYARFLASRGPKGPSESHADSNRLRRPGWGHGPERGVFLHDGA